MAKSESWYVVRVNLGGVTKPIRCYIKGFDVTELYDKDGYIECTMKYGMVSIGLEGWSCQQFQTKDKREAEIFYMGTQAVAKLLVGMFGESPDA
jgi:hypothetical protein